MPLRPGSMFAGYRIEALVGRGGMGEVYRATDLRLDRTVALKLVSEALAEAPNVRERFLSESRLAASLDHPHIVPVYAAGEADGVLYLAMRFVAGADLESIIRRERRLAPPRALSLLKGIADGIDAAHDRGLVHRDIKPSNILVARDDPGNEHAYLGDFGLVKRVKSGTGLTAPGELLGSVDYVAPEQVEGRPVDRRADVYSLAGALYAAVTGAVPFPRETDMATLWAHVQSAPPKPSEIDPSLAPLDEVIARGMAKVPSDRYGSAAELIREASAAIERGGSPVVVPMVIVRPRMRLHGRQLLPVVTAAVVLAVVAAVLANGGAFGPAATSSPAATTPTTTSGTVPTRASQGATEGPSASIDLSVIRSVPLGLPLEPGRYQTRKFRPALTFVVDDGWTTVGAQFGDDDTGFDLVRRAKPTDRITIVWSNTVSSTGCIEDREGLRIGSGDTGPAGRTQLTVSGSLPVLDKLERDGLLATDPWLHLGGHDEPDQARILSRVGVQADITVLRTLGCVGGQDGAAIVRRNAESGRPDVDEWVILREGAWARVMPAVFGTVYEEVAGELIIVIQSADRADFDAFLPIANAFLESTLLSSEY